MTGRPKTVHLIFNAHIDPVWLWPWQAGLDATIDTFRTMCRLLEVNPEVTFCHDTAWLYREVERIQPELIARVAELVDQGRWAIAGGVVGPARLQPPPPLRARAADRPRATLPRAPLRPLFPHRLQYRHLRSPRWPPHAPCPRRSAALPHDAASGARDDPAGAAVPLGSPAGGSRGAHLPRRRCLRYLHRAARRPPPPVAHRAA